jgi:hypothetical protein
MAEEKSPNPEAEVAEVESPSPNPNAGESGTPAASIENAPSSDESKVSDFPTANAPDPQATIPEANPDALDQSDVDPAEANPPAKKPAAKAADKKKPEAEAADGKKPDAKAAKAKKEKAPAVEDKPFTQFIEQDYLPALKKAFAKEGIEDVKVTFVKDKIQIPGISPSDACWQVAGSWKDGQRRFNIYFPEEDISKLKAFSWATNGTHPSTLESFMIDERRVTLDLMVFYTMQRLNAQKWLARN